MTSVLGIHLSKKIQASNQSEMVNHLAFLFLLEV